MNAVAVNRSSLVSGSGTRAHSSASIVLGLTGLGVWAVAVALAASGPGASALDRALREGLIVGLPLAAGLYAVRSPRDARFGYLLIAAAFMWSLTALGQSSESLPYSIGRVAAWLILPFLYYLMMAYPDGRLEESRDRRLIAAIILLIAVLFIGSALFVEAYPRHTPWASCGPHCPPNAFMLVDREPAIMAAVVQPLRELLGVAVMIGVAVSLIQRMRRATRMRRRQIAPVAVMGVVSALILAAFLLTRRAAGDTAAADTLGTLWALCVPGVAAAFLIGLLRRRLLVASVLKRLSTELRGGLDGRRLRTALALALDDPTVDLLTVGGAPARWRDLDGRPASRSELFANGRATTVITEGEAPVAALVHDPALREDEELLSAVTSIVVGALQQERLTAQLRTSLDELEESRHRIAIAADLERSRIERDLHDGAQQRLIKIRIGLSLAEELIPTDPDAAAHAVHDLGDEIDLALEELRSLAHGVYPSLLSDRGLEDALRSVAAESPLPVQLDAHGVTRHPAEIETAVYFACLEALQNAIKHGHGTTCVWITLRQNHALSFRVGDDGPGFVAPDRAPAGGLRNMRDRVEAVGGRLTIDASPGHGTLIRGDVPLPQPARPPRAAAKPGEEHSPS